MMKTNNTISSAITNAFKLIALTWAFLSVNKLNAQSIEFVQNTVDVGLTTWYEPIKATFYFKNVSDHDIQVIDVDPGCGCLDPTWTKETVRAGGKGKIIVTYNAEMLGHFDRNIVVIVKDEMPLLVRMKCKVVSDKVEQTTQPVAEGWGDDSQKQMKDNPVIQPPVTNNQGPVLGIPNNLVSVGNYKANKRLKGKLLIKNEGKEVLLVNSIRPVSRAILIDDVKVGIPPGKIYTVKFQLDTWQMATQDEKCEMVIESNDPVNPHFSVFVHCE